MFIIVTATPNENQRTFNYSLSDLGITKEEWEELNDDAKSELLQDALNGEPEQPYWFFEKYKELG